MEYEASLNLTDKNKDSVIHICAKRGHSNLMQILLDKHPVIDGKNKDKKTPMQLAKNERISNMIKEHLKGKEGKQKRILIHNIGDAKKKKASGTPKSSNLPSFKSQRNIKRRTVKETTKKDLNVTSKFKTTSKNLAIFSPVV